MKLTLYVQETALLGITVNMVRLSAARLIKTEEVSIELPETDCVEDKVLYLREQAQHECKRIKQEITN